MLNVISALNSAIALRMTKAMSTMWCVYAFFVLAIVPVFLPTTTTVVMFISSSLIQLCALPLILVGQQLLGATAENRAESDHLTLLEEFEQLKVLHAEGIAEMAEIKSLHADLRAVLVVNGNVSVSVTQDALDEKDGLVDHEAEQGAIGDHDKD